MELKLFITAFQDKDRIYRLNEKCFVKPWDMVPHTEKMKKVHMSSCLKWLCFRAIALLYFRMLEDNNLSSIAFSLFLLFTNVLPYPLQRLS
jgi:hypothetical protein